MLRVDFVVVVVVDRRTKEVVDGSVSFSIAR
jgi:hypothetical protein